MGRAKGNRRERGARGIYESAGYEVRKAFDQRYGPTDFFGHFDFMAIRSDSFRLVQVKSSSASGIVALASWARWHVPPWIDCEYAVYHDGEGWRLVQVSDSGHETVYDERDDEDVGPHVDTDLNTGEGLTAHLSRG